MFYQISWLNGSCCWEGPAWSALLLFFHWTYFTFLSPVYWGNIFNFWNFNLDCVIWRRTIRRITFKTRSILSKILLSSFLSLRRFGSEIEILKFFISQTRELIMSFLPSMLWVCIMSLNLIFSLFEEKHSVSILTLIEGLSMLDLPCFVVITTFSFWGYICQNNDE